MQEYKKGIQLFVKRIFIMDDCKDLLPDYLRFTKGVVDSTDLPLNVSRELLQENKQLQTIQKNLVSKILSTIKDMKEKDNEAYLFGANISPLPTASTHIKPDPVRTRKLLLHRRELDKLTGNVERKGYSVVPLSMYWSKGHVKLSIGLAKGKQNHDKRQSEKQRDWAKEKQRLLKSH